MRLIKLAAGVLNQTPLDWPGNRHRILAAVDAAREQGVSILCLPELCISGYGCEDAFLSPDVERSAWEMLHEIVPECRGLVVSLGLPLRHEQRLYDAACLISDGRLLGFVAKRFLAGEGIHYEPRWFSAWPGGCDTFRRDDRTWPLGDCVFDCDGVRIAFEICEDAWAADRPGAEAAAHGVHVILNPSASHFAFGKARVRERLVLEGSRAFGVAYVYSNLVGNEAGRAIYDGDAMIAAAGEIVARNTRFSYREHALISAVVDVYAAHPAPLPPSPSAARAANEVEPILYDTAFTFQESEALPATAAPASWESGEFVKEEEFTRAVALGLIDYMRKSRSKGFIVSLSGGVDSSATACLVAYAVRLLELELGPDELKCKLHSVSESIPEPLDATQWIHAILTTVYQSTANSSETTRRAARDVAASIGAKHYEFDVEDLVQRYIGVVSEALGRPLAWDTDDVALQNIQARVRAPGVWMLANLKSALLLSTSNRSEAAVGYATMDGDTSGGLAPIAGIDKAFLRRWLSWAEDVGPAGVGANPSLAAVNAQEPTAELRPPSAEQTDEADLMPYELLDAIQRAAIRDRRSPREIFRWLAPRFPLIDRKQLITWIERFFKLWARNQWKRERYAPSFHLDDQNLDPKTWCRFPILSGHFERELQELRRQEGA